DHCVLIGDRVLHGEVWRLLTYGFLHSTDNLLHIILNMYVLFLFGREMEEHYGPREFLAFYLVGLMAAGLVDLGTARLGLNNTSLKSSVLGASGAVTAVMVLFAFHFPMKRILLLGLIPMPVWLLVVIFVGIDLLGMLFYDAVEGERIAFAAHIGGAAFGAL